MISSPLDSKSNGIEKKRKKWAFSIHSYQQGSGGSKKARFIFNLHYRFEAFTVMFGEPEKLAKKKKLCQDPIRTSNRHLQNQIFYF